MSSSSTASTTGNTKVVVSKAWPTKKPDNTRPDNKKHNNTPSMDAVLPPAVVSPAFRAELVDRLTAYILRTTPLITILPGEISFAPINITDPSKIPTHAGMDTMLRQNQPAMSAKISDFIFEFTRFFQKISLFLQSSENAVSVNGRSSTSSFDTVSANKIFQCFNIEYLMKGVHLLSHDKYLQFLSDELKDSDVNDEKLKAIFHPFKPMRALAFDQYATSFDERWRLDFSGATVSRAGEVFPLFLHCFSGYKATDTSNNDAIASLSFAGNYKVFGREIVRVIKLFKNLTELDISRCYLAKEDWKEIPDRLSILNLSSINWPKDAEAPIQEIIACIKRNKSLQILHLKLLGSLLGANGFLSLSAAQETNWQNTLKVLSLTWPAGATSSSDLPGLKEAMRWVATLTSLETLTLDARALTTTTEIDLMSLQKLKMLRLDMPESDNKNNKIHSLDLNKDSILARVITAHAQLEKIELNGCTLTAATLSRLARLCDPSAACSSNSLECNDDADLSSTLANRQKNLIIEFSSPDAFRAVENLSEIIIGLGKCKIHLSLNSRIQVTNTPASPSVASSSSMVPRP